LPPSERTSAPADSRRKIWAEYGMDSYDALVVGGSAAGLSAALILGRSGRRTLVCDDGRPRNAAARAVHGFLTREGVEPHELLRLAREDVARYPSVTVRDVHVASAKPYEEGFVISAGGNAATFGRTLLLAAGMYDDLPQIAGLDRFWGRAAFSCPYCDAWEFRNKRIAVIGEPGRGRELAAVLEQWSDDVWICEESSVARIDGSDVPEIVGYDGSRRTSDAIFVSAPLRLRHPLVDQLGLQVRGDGEIEVDECGRTSIPGCYAAGDAVTTAHQLILASASGIRAAMAINEDLPVRSSGPD